MRKKTFTTNYGPKMCNALDAQMKSTGYCVFGIAYVLRIGQSENNLEKYNKIKRGIKKL